MTGGHTLTDRVSRMESVIEGIIRIMGTDDENHNLYQMVTEMRSSLRGHTAQLGEMDKRVSATAGSSSSSSFTETQVTVEGLKQDVLALKRSVEEGASRVLLDECTTTVESLAEEVAVLKKAVAATPVPTTERSFGENVKVPEPKSFAGTRSSKELENFLWDVEQYFQTAKIPVARQVAFAAMYLTGDAKLWWRNRCTDDSAPRVGSWEEMRRELKAQFLPTNASWVARESLRKLKQVGSVRDYVKEFTSLMLDVKGMSEEDKVFNFVAGLKPWAQAELRRNNVKDLAQALQVADGLVDLQMPVGEAVKDQRKKDKDWSEKRAAVVAPETSSKEGKVAAEKPKGKGCFRCGREDHRVRDCPVPARGSGVNAVQVEEVADDGAPIARVGVLRLQN